MDDIKVELKRHRGTVDTDIGPTEVDLPQSVVMVNGIWAGYIGDAPGSHISMILTNLMPDQLAEIKRQVDEIRGNESIKISQAKTVEESARVKASDVSLSDISL